MRPGIREFGRVCRRTREFPMARLHRNTSCDLCCPCVAMPVRSARLRMHAEIDLPSSCRGIVSLAWRRSEMRRNWGMRSRSAQWTDHHDRHECRTW